MTMARRALPVASEKFFTLLTRKKIFALSGEEGERSWNGLGVYEKQ